MVTKLFSLPSLLVLNKFICILGVIILEEQKGLIFDIQPYSVHDGPGCRTLVFLSGCPLRCEWCANPEGIEFRKRIMYTSQKCKNRVNGCVRCIEACPHNAIKIGNDERPIIIDRNLCKNCDSYNCVKACIYEALRLSGEWMTLPELMRVFDRDRQYWGSNGGVTFSGGEAFVQKDFLLAALKRCKEAYIHTAIETTAHVPTDVFLEVMQYVDFAFIDVKHMDSKKHKEKTGVNNELILKNVEALTTLGWEGRLVLRIPIIRNYNDTDENILSVINFMKKIGLFEVNILPFHRLGATKWEQLGMDYKYKDEVPTAPEKLDHIQDLFLDQRIACYKGHETPF